MDVYLPPATAENSVESPSALRKLLSRPVGALLTLLLAVFTVYSPALNAQFVWDDTMLVKTNLLIRSPRFVLEVFRHSLFGDDSNFYRPTQTLTFIADYWVWGLNPFGYHLTSVLIHALNAFLLCLVLRRTLPAMLPEGLARRRVEWFALSISLIWAVHPVHSAAVAYVSGTADTLAMAFCLSAMLLCERALDSTRSFPRLASATGALLCLLLGLCAKEIASIWLLLYLIYLFRFRERTSRHACWIVVALASVALVAYVGLRQLPPPAAIPPPPPKLPFRGLLMFRALGDYGSLLLLPTKLFMERQVFAAPGLANAQSESFYNALAVGGGLLLVAFALGAWWSGNGQRLRRIGAGWFIIGFLPISNLFALNASVAEHWLYLPSIGFLLFLMGVGLDLPPLRRRFTPYLVGSLLGLAVVALGLRTWYRAFDWADEITFFRQTIADGGDVPRARAGLAGAYGHQAVNTGKTQDSDQAVAMLRKLVRQFPRVSGSRINLANLLAQRGDTAEAKTLLETTVDILFADRNLDPHQLVTALKRLDVLEVKDPAWPERRLSLLNRAFRRRPDSWDLVEYGIMDRERANHPEEALALATHFTRTHWWHAPARRMVGQLEAGTGQVDEALATWTEASRLDVHDAEAFSSAASLCLEVGRLPDAHTYQTRAVERHPDSPRQRLLLAQVLEHQGDHAMAQAEVARARSLVSRAEEN